MKHLRTKHTHFIIANREKLDTTVYIKVTELLVNKNGVAPKGYFYIIHPIHNREIIIEKFYPTFVTWEEIKNLETEFSPIEHNNSIQQAVSKRITDVLMYRLKTSGNINFGINPEDWEEFEFQPISANIIIPDIIRLDELPVD